MYAPASHIMLKQDGDRLVGYAAPSNGRRPSLLALYADDRPISVVRATRFNAIAAQQRLRHGWCGVEIIGLSAAAALGHTLTVRCFTSSKVVWRYRVRGPIRSPNEPDRPLSVFDVVKLSQAVDCADRIESIEPFISNHIRRHGPHSYVEASYRTFLGRPPEGDVLSSVDQMTVQDVMEKYPRILMLAKEFTDRPFRMVPGPFNHAFSYDTSPLDVN